MFVEATNGTISDSELDDERWQEEQLEMAETEAEIQADWEREEKGGEEGLELHVVIDD